MTRPESIEEWAWEKAWYWMDDAALLLNVDEDDEALIQRTIARALQQARADAFEEAAKVATEFTTQRQAILEVEYEVNSKYNDGATVEEFVPVIANRIAFAIRSKANEKG